VTRAVTRKLSLLLAAALIGGLGALALTHAGNQQASAQEAGIQLTREQLVINQRISSAAVRRSNNAIQRLPQWVVVLADGELVRSSGGITVNRIGPGNYRVNFGRPLNRCAFTASQIQPNPGLIGKTGLAVDGNLRTLGVRTVDQDNNVADRNFTVQVTC
jgi:hypothetical protein